GGKVSGEWSKGAAGRTLYILDEPTTGLHFADIEKLLDVLQRLVDAGNTVLVIEHNLDVIKQADWLVDLGPEGGEAGGEIVATGTPEEGADVEESFTGQYLREVLPAHAAPAAEFLLVGPGALGVGEGVADRRRLALERVARAARERQRDAEVVGRARRQRQVREGDVAADQRSRGQHGRGRAAARVGVGRAGLGPG